VKPLLVMDGDSFAHRAYHGVPKTVRRKDGGPGNMLTGVSNYLVRFWQSEQPRAVLVAWDTLTVPTYRHEELAVYQAGREFDKELLEQLDLLPALVEAAGFAVA
jgi:DNA polymerase-1